MNKGGRPRKEFDTHILNDLVDRGYSNRKLAKAFNVHPTTIANYLKTHPSKNRLLEESNNPPQ